VKHRAGPTRLQQIISEAGKFGVVGGAAYVIDVVVSNVCLSHFGMEFLTAKIVSTVVAATFSYVGNRKWSFTHRARTGVRREYTLFFVLNAIGLGISLACLGFAEHVLGLHGTIAFNLFGNVLGTGLGTVFRFWAYKRYVFLHPDHPRAVAAADAQQAARPSEPASRLAEPASRRLAANPPLPEADFLEPVARHGVR
jgi:putative flippase GtrA